MGQLLLWSNITLFGGFLLTAATSTDGTMNWFGITIGVVVNLVTIIRLFIEKKKFKDVKFSTSQLVYIISIAAIGLCLLYFVLVGQEASAFSVLMIILIMLSIFVAIFACAAVGINYLTWSKQNGNFKGQEHFFVPIDHNRNVEISALLRKVLMFCGGLAILVGLITGFADAITPSAKVKCNQCATSGGYCRACGNFGYVDSEDKTITNIAWMTGLAGIGLLVVGSRFKDESSTNDTTDKTDKSTEIWYCKNCATPNSTLLRTHCKKCGQPKS